MPGSKWLFDFGQVVHIPRTGHNVSMKRSSTMFFFFFFVVLGIEPRAMHVPLLELHPWSFVCILFLR
jgi:hypothetical protein